jgi:uncharacterized protein
MSVHLIIDGYNIIRKSPELLSKESQDLRWGREALLEKLAAYRRVKKHPITVVFDGAFAGEYLGNRDRCQGMLIIYSRHGEKADDVIKRLADQDREHCLIISSDREIMVHAERAGAAVMPAEEFIRRLQTASFNDDFAEEEEQAYGNGTKKKGPAHRDSKKLRRQRRRLKKI